MLQTVVFRVLSKVFSMLPTSTTSPSRVPSRGPLLLKGPSLPSFKRSSNTQKNLLVPTNPQNEVSLDVVPSTQVT